MHVGHDEFDNIRYLRGLLKRLQLKPKIKALRGTHYKRWSNFYLI